MNMFRDECNRLCELNLIQGHEADLVLYDGYNFAPSVSGLVEASSNTAPKVAVFEAAVPDPLMGKDHNHDHDHAEGEAHDHDHAEGETHDHSGALTALVDLVKGATVPAIFAETTTNPDLINTVANDAGVKVAEQPLFVEGPGGPGTAAETTQAMLVANTCTIVNALGGTCDKGDAPI